VGTTESKRWAAACHSGRPPSVNSRSPVGLLPRAGRTIAGHYPGDAFTSTTGSTVYYTVYATALNNGYRVQMAWDFYRGYTRLSGGGSPILSSGSSYTWSNVATTVQSGKYGYYAVTRFDYLNPDGSVAFSSYVYCGPTYITGN